MADPAWARPDVLPGASSAMAAVQLAHHERPELTLHAMEGGGGGHAAPTAGRSVGVALTGCLGPHRRMRAASHVGGADTGWEGARFL
ncbi:MAG: hypothetical protein WKF40_04125 [Thermoleophilaceae bacterium]